MSYPFSQPEAGAGISATVKWCDPAKGYDFLVPDDGMQDVFSRAPVLEATGLATLLTGARVECETVRVERGQIVAGRSAALMGAGGCFCSRTGAKSR